jgi:hypothetical protein
VQITDPPSPQKGRPYNKRNRRCLKIIFIEQKNWSQVSDDGPTLGQTGQLAVARNITFSRQRRELIDELVQSFNLSEELCSAFFVAIPPI